MGVFLSKSGLENLMKTVTLLTAGTLVLCAIMAAPALAQDIPAPTADTNAQYQAQQQDYQQQLQQNQQAQQDYQNEQQNYRDRRAHYEDQTATYEALRARFAAERAGYHRYVWPGTFAEWRLKNDGSFMGIRVNLVNGNAVGNVVALARTPDGVVEGLAIKLDSGQTVWIDATDARFDRFHGTIITDLYASDLRLMADERLG
jgi:C-terminal processing protease CtpA/Prc